MSALSPTFLKKCEQARALEVSRPDAKLSDYPYTEQQLRIINHLLAGRSNKDVAEQMVLTVNGVKDHLTRIYKIAGVHSRMQLMRKFLGRHE